MPGALNGVDLAREVNLRDVVEALNSALRLQQQQL